MATYLLLDRAATARRLTLEPAIYSDRWIVVAEDGQAIPDSGFFLVTEALKEVSAPVDTPAAPSGFFSTLQDAMPWQSAEPDVFYELRSEAAEFAQFYSAWSSNHASMTRGIGGYHRTWSKLQNGTLASEGDRDYPAATMDNAVGISWLPTSFCGFPDSDDVSEMIAMGSADGGANRDVLTPGKPVPWGLIVHIPVGRHRGPRVCWLNAGEIVVRGPLHLSAGQFSIFEVVFFDGETFSRVALPPGVTLQDLPPRPFNATRDQAEQWLAHAKFFYAQVATAAPQAFA